MRTAWIQLLLGATAAWVASSCCSLPEHNIGSLTESLASEAAANLVHEFQTGGGSLEGQKLALVVRENPIRVALTDRTVDSLASEGQITLETVRKLFEGERRNYEVELTVDVAAAVEAGVLDQLATSGAWVFPSQSVDAVLVSMGIDRVERLLEPAVMDRFREQVRSEGGDPIDGLLVAVHYGDQHKDSAGLDHLVRLNYIDIRPRSVRPVRSQSRRETAELHGILRSLDQGP